MSKVDDLVAEAVARCAERATVEFGREPTRHDVSALLFQSQLSALTMYLCESDEELERFWQHVVTIAKGGRTTGVPS